MLYYGEALQNWLKNICIKAVLFILKAGLKTRYWEDKDHNKKVATEIIADNLIMLDKRSDAGIARVQKQVMRISRDSEIPPIDEGSEKLPF